MRFSDRVGITQPKSIVQLDSMDDDLRNGLWNALYEVINGIDRVYKHSELPFIHIMLISIWADVLKRPVDTLNDCGSDALEQLREYYYSFEWFEVYNLVEHVMQFMAQHTKIQQLKGFKAACNAILDRELSGFRFIGSTLSPITAAGEVQQVEAILVLPLDNVRTHIQQALTLLSSKPTPDFRNSIKESISAVEALCRLISVQGKTLGTALKDIESSGKVEFPKVLSEGLIKLYGFTNGSGGIRHAIMEESSLELEDARFMLVSCSAFINYLVIKADKAGIKLT